MKKVLVAVVVLALVAWVLSWFRTPEAVATSAARPWPSGMGRLDSAASRLPAVQANAGPAKLTALAATLPKDEAAKPIDDFVLREIARGELPIGQGPAIPDVTPIREMLLREPIVWEHRLEVGDAKTIAMRTVQMSVARTLVASALTKARANDPAGWEDLHAVWKLARSLDGHPQVMAQTAALSMARMINAVAWKMPLPAPAWVAEVQERDNLQPLLEAFQHQTASYWEDGARLFPTKFLADSVDHDRAIAEELVKLTTCDVSVPMNKLGTDMTSVWRRAFRFRAEREASANALRIRQGQPIHSNSRCTDGSWTYDGTTLRFSREIATPAPDTPMPLLLKVQPQPESRR